MGGWELRLPSPPRWFLEATMEKELCGKAFVNQKMLEDESYTPYCLNCRTMRRMIRISQTVAECPDCGAIHDAAAPLKVSPPSPQS